MKALIKKELRLFVSSIVYMIIFGLILCDLFSGFYDVVRLRILYSFLAVIWGYSSMVSVRRNEIKTKSHVIFSSLPVKRHEMVIAKYISLILYVLIIWGILYVGSNFFSLLNHHNVSRGLRIGDLLLVLSYLMLILSAYLPLGYEHMEIKFMLFDVMFFINTWLLQGILIGYGSNILNSLSKLFFNLNYTGVAVVLFLISVIIYIISLNTSAKILERKDL